MPCPQFKNVEKNKTKTSLDTHLWIRMAVEQISMKSKVEEPTFWVYVSRGLLSKELPNTNLFWTCQTKTETCLEPVVEENACKMEKKIVLSSAGLCEMKTNATTHQTGFDMKVYTIACTCTHHTFIVKPTDLF